MDRVVTGIFVSGHMSRPMAACMRCTTTHQPSAARGYTGTARLTCSDVVTLGAWRDRSARTSSGSSGSSSSSAKKVLEAGR